MQCAFLWSELGIKFALRRFSFANAAMLSLTLSVWRCWWFHAGFASWRTRDYRANDHFLHHRGDGSASQRMAALGVQEAPSCSCISWHCRGRQRRLSTRAQQWRSIVPARAQPGGALAESDSATYAEYFPARRAKPCSWHCGTGTLDVLAFLPDKVQSLASNYCTHVVSPSNGHPPVRTDS